MKSKILSVALLIAGCNSNDTKLENTNATLDSIYLYDTITYVFPELPFDTYDSVIVRRVAKDDSLKVRNWYQFDMNTRASGCADVLLQKVSPDLQNELRIEMGFDKLPKYKWLDITNYSKSIYICLNKYDKNNKYVEPICNDYLPRSPEPLTKYIAVSGSLNIVYWSQKDLVVCVMTKDLILQDNLKNELHLPFEFFDRLRVYWRGGEL